MAIALPESLGLFIHMQEDLCHVKCNRVTLAKGVHQDQEYFRWLAQHLERRPTCLYKLFPIQSTLDGYHNSSGYNFGGSVLPVPIAVPRTLQLHPSTAKATPGPTGAHPIVCRTPFPEYVSASLVSW